MKEILKKILIKILENEARLVLEKYKPKVVGITGSVGKTSTKDAVYAVLAKSFYTRKSAKSFNSEIGVPLTILGLPNAWNSVSGWLFNILRGLELIFTKNDYPEWLVLEIGADKPGDIKRVANWLKLDVAVVTRIGKMPVHIEFFKTLDQLIKEKSSLLSAVRPGGLEILSADDSVVAEFKDITRNRVITFGFNDSATIKASNLQMVYGSVEKGEQPSGVTFRFDYDGKSLPVVIDGAFGINHTHAALAALALAYGLDLNMLSAAEALRKYELPPGRMRLLDGVKNTLIIDDSYNSSPIAAEAALQILDEIKIKRRARKIAVLGDMLELGRHTDEAHRELGRHVAKVAYILVTVGPRARLIADGALDGGLAESKIFQYEDSRLAGKFVEELIKDGDMILVKGSQGMRMEHVVEEIMAHPEEKNLLVRQDPEWLKR